MAEVSFSELLGRAALCRCPRCGKSGIYASFLKFRERCGFCGLALAKNDNGDGPAVFLIFILGFGLIPPFLVLAMNVDWPLWVHALLGGVVILGATFALLRPIKALTLGLQYRYRREVFDES